MAKINVGLAFGVSIEITSIVTPDKQWIEEKLAMAQSAINTALLGAVGTVLRSVPGITVRMSDAKTSLKVTSIQP